MKPLVSIVIPVYNGENFLRQAINSALAQTYDNIEILVINDGSTDGTEEIAFSYGNSIRYFTKENGGVSTALNMAIANMKGEFFSWLSHDDLYRKDKIEHQMKMIKDTPGQIVYSDYAVINRDGKILAVMDIRKKYPDSDLALGLLPVLRQVLNGCTMLIHRSHFDRIGMFDENLHFTQDYDLWFRMLRNERLVYVNEPLVCHREHESQVTHNYEGNRLESDALWLRMLEQTTSEEACLLDGSERNFWNRQLDMLQLTRYKNAMLYAKKRAKACGNRGFHPSMHIKQGVYKLISAISLLAGKLGIKRYIKNGKLFGFGYKIWFGMRYK